MAIYGNVVGSSKKIPINNNGTVYSSNADYAEIGQWADGNPDNENRIGYFVAVDNTAPGITMVKATSDMDIRGVTVEAPAFSGGHTNDKIDTNGNLLPQYSYVAVMGLVSIIDNGTCTINERCMANDDGTAIPSINNLGYQVMDRIDDTHVLIAVEPSADMLIRIKEDISGKVDKEDGKGLSTNDLTDTLKSNYDTAYIHSQSAHARTDATKVEASTNGKIKINGTDTVVYTHPDTHAAVMITEDATHRFVSDAEKSAWNNKLDSYTETDPTVPDWAKAATKPTYTASEVGAADSNHIHATITIGPYTYDGSTNITIPVYDGETKI